MIGHAEVDELETVCDLLDPPGHGVAGELYVVAGVVDFFLPEEEEVVGVFANGDVR